MCRVKRRIVARFLVSDSTLIPIAPRLLAVDSQTFTSAIQLLLSPWLAVGLLIWDRIRMVADC